MLKLKNTDGEYEVTGSIKIDVDGETRTNYTIVIEDETLTIQIPHQDWEVIEVPDPVVEVVEEPVVEPEPVVPAHIPEPTTEELAIIESQRQADEFMQKLRKWSAQYDCGVWLQANGKSPTAEEYQRYTELKEWLLNNYKAEYAEMAAPFLPKLIQM